MVLNVNSLWALSDRGEGKVQVQKSLPIQVLFLSLKKRENDSEGKGIWAGSRVLGSGFGRGTIFLWIPIQTFRLFNNKTVSSGVLCKIGR